MIIKKSTKEKFKQLEDYMPNQCFRVLIYGVSGTGKTNTFTHILLKPLIYYDKVYIYMQNVAR